MVRFSMRSLLLSVIVAAFAFVYIETTLHNYDNERRCALEFQQPKVDIVDGTDWVIASQPPWCLQEPLHRTKLSTWVVWAFRDQHPQVMRQLVIPLDRTLWNTERSKEGSPVLVDPHKADLRLLQGLTGLQRLRVTGTLNAMAMVAVGKAPALRSLVLMTPKVNDRTNIIGCLSQLNHLRELDVCIADFRGSEIASFPILAQLETIVLSEEQLDEGGRNLVERMASLRKIRLLHRCPQCATREQLSILIFVPHRVVLESRGTCHCLDIYGTNSHEAGRPLPTEKENGIGGRAQETH